MLHPWEHPWSQALFHRISLVSSSDSISPQGPLYFTDWCRVEISLYLLYVQCDNEQDKQINTIFAPVGTFMNFITFMTFM